MQAILALIPCFCNMGSMSGGGTMRAQCHGWKQWLSCRFLGSLVWLMMAAALASAASAPMPLGTGTSADFAFVEPQFETISDPEWIDNQIVTALAQDARGLIWIGTQNGLLRYDGYRFRRFAHNIASPTSIASDFVQSLCAGKDGRLWIGSLNDGVSVFDPASEQFENFHHVPDEAGSLGAGRISALLEDANGGIWIATDQGLDYLPPQAQTPAKTFTHFRHDPARPDSLLDDKVRSLAWDKQGRLWVGSNNGLQRLMADGKRFETISSGQNVQILFVAQDGKLWLGTRLHGAAWLAVDAPGAVDVPRAVGKPHWLALDKLSHPWVLGIAQVAGGQVWLATYGGGINIVAPDDGRVLQQLRHEPTLPGSLAHDTLKPLMLDRAGWLWVGSWGAGLQRTNANNTTLRLLRHSPARPAGLSYPDIGSILELANGQLLFGSNGNGIDVFDRKKGLVGGYRKGQPGQVGMLPDATVLAVAQTRDGSVWAGTEQGGVVRQLAGSQSWEVVPGLPGQSVSKFLLGQDGVLWAGTDRGLARLQTAASGAPHFEAIPADDGKPMRATIWALAEDRQGNLWVGSSTGLWLLQAGTRGLSAMPAEPKKPDGLISDSITSLLVDKDDRLWLVTGKGLERLLHRAGKQATFEHVSAMVGYAGTSFGGNLMQDKVGRIWTSEAVIDPLTMRMTRVSRADGMDAGACWNGSYAQSRDGLMFFGCTKGVVIINPALFKPWDYAPPLVLLALKVNDRYQSPGALAMPPQAGKAPAALTLTPGKRSFALEFAALDYSDPRKNRYQYRLQGYDPDWIETDTDHRSANYGNLPPGEYTLQVRGSNRLGQWSGHELAIPIKVLPAWWQHWWFRLLAVLLLAGMAHAAYRWRLMQMRSQALAEARALRKLVSERTRDIKLAHDELALAHQHLQQTQAQLVQAEKMASLGGLVAGIAHAINTPLGTALVAISGVAKILQGLKSVADSNALSKKQLDADLSEALEYADLAQRSSSRAGDLVGSFKLVAVGADEEQSVDIDLARFLPASASLLRTQLEQQGCTLEISVPPGLYIHLVPDALQQALNPVFANVRDHAFADGRIGLLRLLARREENGDVLIELQDNGHGIAPDDLPKVFDPFFTTRSGAWGHVGLGLHVAFNHVTQRLKGSIRIASSLGQGTTVTIVLGKHFQKSPSG
jgi:ligand-binding sensor domain-containing protein/signal transduction histidine kinase